MPGFPFKTRLTVASLTPACFATSASLPGTLQFYDKGPQVSRKTPTSPRTTCRDAVLMRPREGTQRIVAAAC
jgi:hypothetical protein